MQLVLFYYRDKDEFNRVMELVKDIGEICNNDEIKAELNENKRSHCDYIYVHYQTIWYKFNRYDLCFIEKVKEAIRTHPFQHCPGLSYEGPFTVETIDDRFTNKKYYEIVPISKNKETLVIHTNRIIDDLYNNCLLQ